MTSEFIGEARVDGVAHPIAINPETRRMEVHIGDRMAFVDFRVRGSVISLIHTEVPEALRGHGLADTLARAALDYARRRGMTVKPICPFVAKFIARHPEFQDLVDAEF